MHIFGIIGFVAATLAGVLPAHATDTESLASRATLNGEVPKIAGGEPAAKDKFDFVANLRIDSETRHTLCTGSLIGSNVVLTAGHCIVDSSSTDFYDKTSFTVKFTHKSNDANAEAYAVSKVVGHPDFDLGTLSNDVALLILEDDVPDNVASVIKIYNGDVSKDMSITAAGFGLTDPKNSSSIATELMEVDLKLGTDSYCKGIYGNYDPKYLLCSDGTIGKDTCSGDSGGPLVASADDGDNVALLGSTSFAPVTKANPEGLCAQKGSSGYYVHLSAYLPWIVKEGNLDEDKITISDLASSDEKDSDDDTSSGSAIKRSTSVSIAAFGAKQIQDIKNFLEVTRRKDATGVRVKKNGNVVKFKVRCARYLYTLTVADAQKAIKLRQSLPPGLEVKDVPKASKNRISEAADARLASASESTESDVKPEDNAPSNMESGKDDASVDKASVFKGKRKFGIMLALLLSTFLVGLDTSIISTMLPKISEKFEALSLMAWIVSSFMIGITALLPIYGKLCHIFGYREVLLAAHALFLVGSVICGASTSAGMLIAGRTIAGLGGGGMMTINYIVVGDLVPPAKSIIYMSTFSVMWAVAAVAGPLLGGVFAEKTGFEWGFYINPFVQVFTAVLILIFMRIPRPKTTIVGKLKRIDFVGIATLMAGIVMLQLGLTWGGQDFPWKSAAVIVSLILAVILLVIFVLLEWRFSIEPIMPLRIFQHRNVVLMFVAQITYGLPYYIPPFYIPVYMTIVKNATPINAGLHLISCVLTMAIATIATGMFIRATGVYKSVIVVGSAVYCIGIGLFALWGSNPSNGELIGIPIVFGVGIGMLLQSTIICAQNCARQEDVATTTSLLMSMRMVGGSVGQAVAQTILRNRISPMLDDIAAKYPKYTEVVQGIVSDQSVIWKPDVPADVRDETIDAYVKSLHMVYYVFLAFCGCTVIASVFVKNVPLRKKLDDSENK
ncbi:hypothetical protein H4R20_000761 [Coemansia guatemalensis]|uniref:Major facilitator superfamily (MFS) profile domain-containing protein n=1 Tax=Coemansia guatemalensis TaxID=2761395 RepID=A0A9W8HYB2_9FUNG|nr:hypothetical protein H4R20_000761 [Coemansia guatemalensis]